MHCNHRCYECHIPACPDRVRQSIGPRIVPMFADPPEWSADKVYSPLTLVIHDGATFMSRRCVPANTALPTTDPFYNESWVMVYDMNAQVAQYREEVAKLSQQVTAFGGKIDNWEQLIVQWTALIQGWQNQFPELTKALAAITERVAAIEPKLAQAQKDIAALQATQQTHTEQIAANTQGLADLTPRVAAAETHLSALDEEQKVQDEHLNNLDASQTEQDTRIQANHDLAVQAKNTADNNTQQIAENAGKIAANAAEIAKHAEQLEALKAADTALDGKISQNTAAIAQNTADIAQAKTDIKQAAAAAQQAQDTATHADAAAAQAQTTAQAAQKAAQAAQSAADQAKADNTTQDGRLDALEAEQTEQDDQITAAKKAAQTAQEAAQAAQSAADQAKADNTTQDGRLDALESAQQQTAQDVANLKDGSTELPYVKKVNGNATGTLAVENISVSGTATVGEPVNDTDAASKKYVDQAVQNATGGITPDVTQLKSDVEALQQSQGTQDGKISALETAQTEQDSRLDKLENGTTALPYLKKTGDIGTGTFNFTGAQLQIAEPTADNHPTSKKYVDQAVENATDPELEGRVEALETSQATQDTKLTNIENGTTALPYLKNSGDTSSGTYNFTGSVSVPVPSTSGQAANKQYVDSTINSAITELKSEIGATGPTGHLEFVDAMMLGSGAKKEFECNGTDVYVISGYMIDTTGSTTPENLENVATTGKTSMSTCWGSVTGNTSSFTVSAGGTAAIVTVYKFVADGEQPQPNPTTFFTELNPPVILSATTSHPQSVEGDLSATLNAMIAAQSNWFKYKMQDGSGKTYYVMSASEIQPTDSSAANVLYCTEAGTWYQGETLNLAYGKYGDILISAYYPNFEIVSPGRPNFSVGTFDTAREAVTRQGTDKTFIMAANNAIIRLNNGSDFKNILDNYMQIGTVYTNPDEYHDLRATLFTNGSDSAKPENLDIPSIGPWSDASGWQYKKTY